jgi:adenylate cyclase
MAENAVTQRVAAILAADVAGYTRLMADDETATIDALDAARAVFTEHTQANQGRVVDTAGDSVLAIFETTAGAVLAAMAIQKRLGEINAPVPEARRMRFRIGIHLGDIHEKADGTIYGDGVNIAARLEGIAEPGAIIVSDVVQGALRGRVDVGFADAGSHEVKNVAEPVRAYGVLLEGAAAPSRPAAKRRPLVLAGAGFAVILVGAIFWQLRDPAPEPPPAEVANAEAEDEDSILALPKGPSIAVLPFDTFSEDRNIEYFADGLAEDITTALSRFPDLFVISRNSTFQYKGQPIDVREVGSNLGAEYVLEGSVRLTSDNLRVNAQLLNATDGSHLWAETFDRDFTAEDLFEIQDSITEQVVSIIGDAWGVLAQDRLERVRGLGTQDLGSYACVARVQSYIRTFAPDEHLAVRTCLEETVENDPGYANAWAWLARLIVDEHQIYQNPKPNSLDRALAAAQRAVELDPQNDQAQAALADAHFHRLEMDEFAAAAKRTLDLNPNSSAALAEIGYQYAYMGEWDRGITLLRKAQKLNPRHPNWYFLITTFDQYGKGQYEAALTEAQKINMPGFFLNYMMLGMIYGQMGRLDEAKAALEKLDALWPGFTMESARDFMGRIMPDASVREKVFDGLRKAGLPEAAPAPSRPVIAVLPFDSMSEDAAHQFFADGIVEDIITRLARFSEIGVIARNSSFQYKGEAVDVRAVAEELGATYVLEGSVRRSENDIRVVAQLLDATDGTHLWAETYDRDLTAGSVFEIQDDITARVVGAIASGDSVIAMAVVNDSEGKAPADLASYECVLRAYEYWRVITPDVHLDVRNCLEIVINNEPDYAQAFAVLANVTIDELLYGYNPRPNMTPPLDRALAHAQQAVDIDPKSAWAHWALARTAYYRHNIRLFRTESDRALELAPNDTLVLAVAGHFLAYSGSWERGMSIMAKAIELNPHHQTWYHFSYFYDAYRQGLDEDALAAAQRINMPGFFWTHQVLAAAYAQLGMATEAADAVATLQEMYPGYSIQTMIDLHRMWNHGDDVINRMADGLRKAGLPEETN